MPTHDNQGRPYANIDDLKAGMTVYLDGGFPCHRPGAVQVHGTDNPHFKCKEGSHKFDGQIDDESGILIGVYLTDPGPLDWENRG